MISHAAGLGFAGLTSRVTGHLRQRFESWESAATARKELVGSLPLTASEHVLTTARDSQGRHVVASDRARYHCRRELRRRIPTRDEWLRVGWETVARVSWDDEGETLTLWTLLPRLPRTVLHLPGAASMADLARDRVAAATVVRTTLDLQGYGAARVIGRRAPGTEELVWFVALDGEAAGRDPARSRALEAALHELRGQLGV